jgi:hypothetical protein
VPCRDQDPRRSWGAQFRQAQAHRPMCTFYAQRFPPGRDRAEVPYGLPAQSIPSDGRGLCPSSPAADRLTPARNAGTSATGMCTPARSRSAAAIPMMRIRGNGIAVSIPGRIRANTRAAPLRRRAIRLMAATGWKRPFANPIPLPGGRQLVTLEDAAGYIMKLPKARAESRRVASGDRMPNPGRREKWTHHDGAHRHDEGAQSPRRARVQSGSQRQQLGKAEAEKRPMTGVVALRSKSPYVKRLKFLSWKGVRVV